MLEAEYRTFLLYQMYKVHLGFSAQRLGLI